MDFEQIKVIWDSQSAEPLYAINEAELHTVVQRRNRECNRREARRYWREISIGLFFGALMLLLACFIALGNPAWIAPLSRVTASGSRWEAVTLLMAGAVWLYYAAYMWSAQKRQQRREEDFAATLRGDIDRALARTGFQIRIARSILWWGFVPTCAASLLWVVTTFRLIGAPAWAYASAAVVMSGAVALSVWCEHRKIATRFEPRQRELEALRQKLTDMQR